MSSKKSWAAEPEQCVNYVSCHDNFTLWDKIHFSHPKAKDSDMRKMMKLAGALILTSQGVPFLHAGAEFCRTKNGNGNSYKSPDTVNQIDWERKETYLDVFEYYKNLIQLRKNHPCFRIPNAELIRKHLNFCTQYQLGIVSYCIEAKEVGDTWNRIIVIFNGKREEVSIALPEGKYRMVVKGDQIYDLEAGEIVQDNVQVESISMMILDLV